MSQTTEAFLKVQSAQFDRADTDHFVWQTANPAFSQTERELLAGFFRDSARLLEIGCGEGGNLINLFAGQSWIPNAVVGVDLFYKKLRFAQEQIPEVTWVCADAHALPFADGTFDAILCRDVLHHVADPDRVVCELARLCTPKGRVVFLEPNRLNPLMFGQAVLHRFERGILHRSAMRLRTMVGRHFVTVHLEYRNPFPVSRVLLHYRYGLSRLGYLRGTGFLLRRCEAVLARLMPRGCWSYICVTAMRQ